MSGIIRVVGPSGTPMDLPSAVATGLIATGVVERVEVAEKPLTAAQQKAADRKAAAKAEKVEVGEKTAEKPEPDAGADTKAE